MSDSDGGSLHSANHNSEGNNSENADLSSSPPRTAASPLRRSASNRQDRQASGPHRHRHSASRNTRGPLGSRSTRLHGEERPTSTPSTDQHRRSGRAANVPTTLRDSGPTRIVPSQRDPENEALRPPWSPIIGPVLHSSAPVDDDLISELGRMFPISGTYGELSEALAHVPLPRQYPVLLFGILSMHQALDRFCNTSGAAHTGSGRQVTSSQTRARNFHFHPVFTRLVHIKSRELLMSHTLQVYSCDPPRDAPEGVQSLLTLVLAHVNDQNPDFLDEYLPPGFAAHEPFAEAKVNTLLRETLRHDRGKLRDILLTNVLTSGAEIGEVVPTLGQLMRILMEKLGPPAESADSLGARNSRATSHLRARMAFLRIATIRGYLAPTPGQQNRQWKRVDELLRWLDSQERSFRRAYFQLCMTRDKELFGRRRIVDIDVESIVLPTDEEVHEKVRSLESEARGRH